jgi:WD40 repeat protein
MKVEIPQILWNCEDASKGLPAALMSLSLLPCGPPRRYCCATAGNCTDVNLWSIEFPIEEDEREDDAVQSVHAARNHSGILLQEAAMATSSLPAEKKTKMDFLCGLTRHEGPVNAVAFSPNGRHLATASDTGAIILWSPPAPGASAAFWSGAQIQKEADLLVRIVPSTHCSGITDLSWSSDSKRFVVGTIDHTIMIFEDIHYHTNHAIGTKSDPTSGAAGVASEWKIIYRNTSYHTHYIQGVAFDPLNVYIGTQSSDRTVRVWQRKEESATKKKTGPSPSATPVAMLATTTNTVHNQLSLSQPNLVRANSDMTETTNARALPPPNESLTINKFEVLIKTKQIKYRTLEVFPEPPLSEDVPGTDENRPADRNTNDVDMTSSKPAAVVKSSSNPNLNKHYLFATETVLESFVRRLSWTVDGAYLIVPAAVWSVESSLSSPDTMDVSSATPPSASSNYATLIYQRHRYDEPWKVLTGLEKVRLTAMGNNALSLFFFIGNVALTRISCPIA